MSVLLQYVDTAMVGHLGEEATAAVSTTTTISWMVNGAVYAFGIAVLALISQACGRGDEKTMKDVSKQGQLVENLNGLEMVRDVNYSEIAADTLSGMNSVIGYVSVGLFIILFANSIFLISNTVIAGIAVRKNEINIMKYIGATDAFVRGPFIVEGILIGLVGSLIPLVIIYYVYNAAVDFVTGRFAILSSMLTFIPTKELFHYLIPLSIVLGVGIGFIGSALTTRRHIHV